MLYEFYAEMKNKKLIAKWDDMKRYDNEPTHLEDYGGKLHDNLCVVDVDDQDHADILTKIIEDLDIQCVIRKTSRGKHFYFRNNGYHSNKSTQACTIGINIELKVGKNQTLNPIKYQGKNREIERNTEKLDFLPFFLKPMGKAYPMMVGLDSNRNDTLRDIQLMLSKRGINYSEFLKIATLINNYVFSEPLYKKFGFNANGVLREDLYPEVIPEFFNDKSFLHVEFAEYIKTKFNICNINSVLHIYKDGVYVVDFREIERSMLAIIPTLKTNQRREVFKYLEITAPNREIEGPDFIPFNDCVLNIRTNQVFTHSPDRVFKNILKVKYNSTRRSKIIDDTLDNISVHDPEIRLLILEMIGYTMYRRNELGKAFILVGGGSNGKSTLLDMIISILGERNTSALDIKELNEKFTNAEVYGKLANIGDDISSKYIEDSAIFKKLVTGNTVTVQEKGENPFKFNSYATMIFSANKLPKTSDKSHGFYRRFCPVPLMAKFSKSDKSFDLEIIDKLNHAENLEYLAYISLESFKGVLQRQAFTEPAKVTKMISDYKIQNSNVLLYLDDFETPLEQMTLSELYLVYQVWCKESGHKHCSKNEFKSEIYDFGYEISAKTTRVNGKPGKYMVEIKNT
jgi:putative DNA primase/helicase